MKRKWLKIAGWIILTPVSLFLLLMILLYIPPVQDFIRRKATSMASEATGLDISVRRIDLRFPLNLLVRDAQVIQPARADTIHADTLLVLGSLNVRIQAWPLLRGQVEVDEVSIENVSVNTADMLPDMMVQGKLGRLFLNSHGIDLGREEAVINQLELSDTHLHLCLPDTTTTPADTTASAPLRWKINLHTLKADNLSVDMQQAVDSTMLNAQIGSLQIEDVLADLGKQTYGWRSFSLRKSAVGYDMGSSEPASGFDPSHIALRNIEIGIDSVLYSGRNLNAVIRRFSLNERSGLSISSLDGRLTADSTRILIPQLRLLTPHSEVALTAQTYWELIDLPTTGRLSARLNARIGKQDVLLFAGSLPESFRKSYPFRPLTIYAGTEGNLRQMQISRLTADLPGAFHIDGGGEFYNLSDTLKRSGALDLEMQTYDLNFLTDLSGPAPDGSLAIPDSMDLKAHLSIEGSLCNAMLHVDEGGGRLHADARYDLTTQAYEAKIGIDSLQIDHFMPKDSIYRFTAKLSAQGQGFDFASHATKAQINVSIDELQYGHWNLNGIDLDASLRSALATLRLNSYNSLLKMQSNAELRLDRKYLDGKLNLHVDKLGLYELGIAPQPLKRPFAFDLTAEARRDSIKLQLGAGDLDFQFRARSTLKELLNRSDKFMQELTRQLENRRLDHAALRRLLPSAGMQLTAKQENPASYFLATKDISFNEFSLRFGFTPQRGINGRTSIHGLRSDSLLLDTIFFAVSQDTTHMQLQGGVINGPKNPQATFRSTLTGEIRNEDAELTASFTDGNGNTGLLLGINAQPLTEGNGKGNGVLLRLTPEEPIIAFRKFSFIDQGNWIYLHKNMRVYAGINMESNDGLAFRMQSNRADTVSLQNINVEFSRFRLSELSKIMPYMPQLTGLFSAEANYIQTDSTFQVSADANIEKLTYEKQPVGNMGMGVTWLPGENNRHYLSAYLSYDDEEIATATGRLTQAGEQQTLDITTAFDHFPLKIANAFVPDQAATLTGDLDGELSINGSSTSPLVSGSLSLDSVSVFVQQLGARYWFDNRPIQVNNNKLTFNRFSIYTTSRNPFAIDGTVDFRDMSNPTANLTLKANNYTLLDAPRTRKSLVYGKVFVDVNATVRGPLSGLIMRGNMNLLGNTNVTYVLTDSPLTVEDRLDGLVSFVSFNDTASIAAANARAVSLGGMNINMTVHIDDAVRLRADLTPDRSKFVELEGGGDLQLQYTPQGDMSLNGRYTLSGGIMKYSLPIIPLKEFQFTNGSYVDWRGNIMNPTLNLKATERVRASVAEGDNGGSRMVNFDVSIAIKNQLEAPDIIFDISAPEDATVENELLAMGAEERSKQAIAMLATGIYLNNSAKGGGLDMGAALNSVLQSQINSLAGGVKGASISVGIEDRTSAETGDKQTDYSFRYSQRFLNDRIQIVIGGKVSTGNNATNNVESFIDNISLEYRLDQSGTRYVRLFHNKNYESLLDGEITETGAGLVLRKKMDRIGELFIFRRKKKPADEPNTHARPADGQSGNNQEKPWQDNQPADQPRPATSLQPQNEKE